MVGLIDGSLSTLAPIFGIALATHDPRFAFIAGLVTALGAAVSMGFSEGLSDTGELTGRGNPLMRGSITGAGTFLGGILHTLPFLIPTFDLAFLRWRYFEDSFIRALGLVTLGGVIIAAVSAGLGAALGGGSLGS
jgi:VIT1/CCC1 family predicted Fe2+/Mn2+ transporter